MLYDLNIKFGYFWDTLCKTRAELSLKTKHHKSFQFSPRQLLFTKKSELKTIVDDSLKRDIIKTSESEYFSPVVLMRKTMGRFACVSIIAVECDFGT